MPQAIPPLRAGVAKSEITADAGCEKIRDRLFAKALVLDDGKTSVVIVAMDTTAIGGRRISQGILGDVGEEFLPSLRRRIQRELRIPGDHVFVNASHTHPPGRLLCDDMAQIERTFDAVRRARANMVEVKIGAGAGHEDRISINRGLRLRSGKEWSIRHANPCPPDEAVVGVGPIDPEIGILRVDRVDGTPLAVLYNFACHPLFGDALGRLTANFPGVASRLIEETLGHGAMAIFLQGAAGNIVDVLFKDFSRPRDITFLGSMLGLSTLRGWRKIRAGKADLAAISEIVKLPRRDDFPERIAALKREQAALLESLRSTTLNFRSFLPLYLQHSLNPKYPSDYSYRYLQDKVTGDGERTAADAWNRRMLDKYLENIRAMERLVVIQEDISTLEKHRTINAEAGESTIQAEVQGIRLGDCVLISSPAELLVEIGLRLKKASPHRRTMVVPFSNGYLHYGAPVEAYSRGGYETMECLLSPRWQAIYERKAIEIMRRLH